MFSFREIAIIVLASLVTSVLYGLLPTLSDLENYSPRSVAGVVAVAFPTIVSAVTILGLPGYALIKRIGLPLVVIIPLFGVATGIVGLFVLVGIIGQVPPILMAYLRIFAVCTLLGSIAGSLSYLGIRLISC